MAEEPLFYNSKSPLFSMPDSPVTYFNDRLRNSPPQGYLDGIGRQNLQKRVNFESKVRCQPVHQWTQVFWQAPHTPHVGLFGYLSKFMVGKQRPFNPRRCQPRGSPVPISERVNEHQPAMEEREHFEFGGDVVHPSFFMKITNKAETLALKQIQFRPDDVGVCRDPVTKIRQNSRPTKRTRILVQKGELLMMEVGNARCAPPVQVFPHSVGKVSQRFVPSFDESGDIVLDASDFVPAMTRVDLLLNSFVRKLRDRFDHV